MSPSGHLVVVVESPSSRVVKSCRQVVVKSSSRHRRIAVDSSSNRRQFAVKRCHTRSLSPTVGNIVDDDGESIVNIVVILLARAGVTFLDLRHRRVTSKLKTPTRDETIGVVDRVVLPQKSKNTDKQQQIQEEKGQGLDAEEQQ